MYSINKEYTGQTVLTSVDHKEAVEPYGVSFESDRTRFVLGFNNIDVTFHWVTTQLSIRLSSICEALLDEIASITSPETGV